MCCCPKPSINGQLGYRWNDPSVPLMVHPVNPPDLRDGEVLLYDSPGRCGNKSDSHSYHFRVIHGELLARHGGGDERIYLASSLLPVLAVLDEDARYWVLSAIFHAHKNAARQAREDERCEWRDAAAEKRIKTRKLPRRGQVKVWIEPKQIKAA